jgi:hypothetical protein
MSVATPVWANITNAVHAFNGVTTNNIEMAVHDANAGTNILYVGVVNNGQLASVTWTPDQGNNWNAMDLPQILTATRPITGATNATPIVITSNNHGLNNGNRVRIAGVTGNTAANADWTVTVVNANNFSLNGSAGNGNYTGGGTWQKITGIQPREKPGSQGGIHFSIAAHPTDSTLVFVGGDRQDSPFPNGVGANDFTANIMRGDRTVAPTGAIPSPQWTAITDNFAGGGSTPHADSREMVFDDNNDLVEADDGGVYRRDNPTTNAGAWFSVNGNLNVSEFWTISYDTINRFLFGGFQDTGTAEQVMSAASAITGASNVTPIVITSAGHGLLTGHRVRIAGVTGNTAANGDFNITRIDANTFSLDSSAGNGNYAGGGTWRQLRWDQITKGDGFFTAVDNISTANTSIHYTVGNDFGSFRRRVFDSNGNMTNNSTVPLNPTLTAAITGATNAGPIVITSNGHGLANNARVNITGVTGNTNANGDWVITVVDANNFSLNGSNGNGNYTGGGTWHNGLNNTDSNIGTGLAPVVINAVDGNLMLLGFTGVYEDNNPAGNAGSNITNITPVGMTGTVRSLAYGGRRDGTAYSQIAYIGTTTGQLWVRGETGGFVLRPVGGSNQISDIVLDPDDWRIAYVLRGNGVFMTVDGGANFTPITDTLAGDPNDLTTELRSLALWDPNPGTTTGFEIVLAGGRAGVYRRLASEDWVEYGPNLPNTIVQDLQVFGNTLVAGTYGRGAWTIADVSSTIAAFPVLEICGDTDYANQDDVIRLVRNAANTSLLDVFINNNTTTPDAQFTLNALLQINVFAAGGNDELIIDSTNGLITLPNGIRYDGDHGCPGDTGAGIGGFDRLTLVQTGGVATGVTDTLMVGPTNGSGRSTIVGPGGTQRVDFQYLEPVVDIVAAASFTITGLPGVASLLQDSNDINYTPSELIGDGGRITIDAFEPIEFQNKTVLVINTGAGDDRINLNNPTTPTGLTTINVACGDPTASDEVIVNGTTGGNNMTFTPTGVSTVGITSTGQPTINLTLVESVIMNGRTGTDTLNIDGTAEDDTTSISPATGTGTFASIGSPALSFLGYEAFSVNGGAGGFDLLALLGTAGTDTVTSAAGSITLNTRVTTVGAGVNRVDLDVLAGNDSVNLSSFTAVTVTNVFGGLGDDNLRGSPGTDAIYGADGNDTLVGAGGDDQVHGEAGNDRIGDDSITGDGVADDPGNDVMFGGDGIDQFVWEPGDGDDVIQGGDDEADILRFFGAATDDGVTLQPNALAPTHLNLLLAFELVDTHGVEQIIVSTLDGDDGINVRDLTPTEVVAVNINLGAGGDDAVTVHGRTVSDDLLVTAALGTVNVAGLAYDVNVLGAAVGDGDDLTLLGHEGNDVLKAAAGVEGTILITFSGGDGADFLSADATLLGGDDNDILIGGAGDDVLDGGAGEDLLQGRGGNDVLHGGAGFDTVLIEGTSGNDVIDVFQSAAGTLDFTVNGVADTDTFTTLEEARIDAKAGDDLIYVGVADALVATPADSLRMTVEGGAPDASDRLVIRDDGLGDLTILRHGPNQRSGTAAVGGLNPIVWNNVERIDVTPIDPITGRTGTDDAGRVVVFHTDPFEYNETLLNAGELGRIASNPTSPTIEPGAVASPDPVAGDEDWYEFRPTLTTTYQVKILFDRIPTLSNGRAGLPGTGDLSLDIYDANGALIVSGVADGDGNNRTAIFAATPLVAQYARIYVRVRGASDVSINTYDFNDLANGGVTNVDVYGPQVTGVNITDNPSTAVNEALYNLFNPKPTDGPTPKITSIQVQIRDLPPRAPGFPYGALEPTLFNDNADGPGDDEAARGLFFVVGDHFGSAPIADVDVVFHPVVVGVPATATVTIYFDVTGAGAFRDSLPDDRWTLTIDDGLIDPPTNRFDGESNASEPLTDPSFPSGNGQPGGDFVARFTVDSRPEIGTYSNGAIFIDINGNGTFDPEGEDNDATNRDLAFAFASRQAKVIAGDFAPAGALTSSGFDKLAAYDHGSNPHRWVFDFDHDGVVDLNVISGVQGSGDPFAGDWSAAHPGDEIGIFNGQKWFLDTNGNNNIDNGDVSINSKFGGRPIAGDFDGDGKDDLATYKDGLFTFDLANDGLDGNADASFTFSFFGPFERPVAADMNLDGVDDIGLYITEQNGPPPSESGEWFFLLSTGTPVAGSVSTLNHAFSPVPLGRDLFYQFGDTLAMPVVGNFDPPAGTAPTVSAGPDRRLTRSGVLTGVGSFADPGSTSWTALVSYGDGSASKPLALNPDGTFQLSHTYAQPGTYQATISVIDDGGRIGTDTITVAVGGPATVDSIIIGDGTDARSMITRITVRFSDVVTPGSGAFILQKRGGSKVQLNVATSQVDGVTQAVLTFRGSSIVGGSLADGSYTLTITGTKVKTASGQLLDGNADGKAGGNYVNTFFRHFGDSDGNRGVDPLDTFRFDRARAGDAFYAAYRDDFDYNSDGLLTDLDVTQFYRRRGKTLAG